MRQRIQPIAIEIVLIAVACCLSSGMAFSQDEDGFKLVWSDDFDGQTLDYSKWGVEQNAFGGGNRELQIYTDRQKNVRVADGYLILEAHKDNAELQGIRREYSSARIRTKHRGDWKYGRIQVRAKLPKGQGIWPAIWMMPTDEKYGSWAASGEIDIMEYRGQNPREVVGTLHYAGRAPANKFTTNSYTLPTGSFSDEFHTFSVDWEEGKIVWSVDGKPYQTQTKWSSESAKFPAPFNERFHLLLNLAVGGGFVGNPDSSTRFPQQFIVDYVRVYQRP